MRMSIVLHIVDHKPKYWIHSNFNLVVDPKSQGITKVPRILH